MIAMPQCNLPATKILYVLIFSLFTAPITGFGQQWESLGADLDHGIVTFYQYHNTAPMLVGGTFSHIDSTMATGIAWWNGSQLGPFADGNNVSGDTLPFSLPGIPAISHMVNAIVLHDGYVTVAGQFDSAGVAATTNIARHDGNQWLPLGNGVGEVVIDLTPLDGDLYVTGLITLIDSMIQGFGVARWDGSSWHGFPPIPNVAVLPLVTASTVHNGELFVSAMQATSENEPQVLARWTGLQWEVVGTFSGNIGHLISSDGNLIAAGRNLALDDDTLSMIEWDGSEWTAFEPQLVGGEFHDLFYSDSAVVGVGSFPNGQGGYAQVAIMRDSAWCLLPVEFNQPLTSVTVFQDKCIAAGGFSTIDGDSIAYVAQADWLDLNNQCLLPSTSIVELNQQPLRARPNPVTSEVNIEGGLPTERYSATLIDTNGRLIEENLQVSTPCRFDMHSLQSGVYLLILKSHQAQRTQVIRLVKE